MDEYLFENNAKSTLASGITSVQTDLSVQSGEGALFPNPTGNQYFLCTLVDSSGNREIIKVTTRSTDAFTVIVRGQEGTTQRAFSADDKVELRATAGFYQDVADELNGLEDGTRSSVLDLNGKKLILDADQDSSITADTDDQLDLELGGADVLNFKTTGLEPAVDADYDLGSPTKTYDGIYGGFNILAEQSAAPTVAADQMGLYSKDVDGQPEAFIREESDGDEIQLTDSGLVALPKGHIHGLILSNDGAPSPDVNITAGMCRDSTDSKNLVLASEITKQLDASWAAGDNAGGLFSGSMAADTWYHVFLIRKNDGTIDAGFDTSITAANIPAGYTEYRRLGSVLSDGTPTNILTFTQVDDTFIWSTKALDVNIVSSAVSASKVNLQMTAPPTISVQGLYTAHIRYGGSLYINIFHYGEADAAPSQDTCDLTTTGTTEQQQIDFMRLTNNQYISYRANTGATVNAFKVWTKGWIDSRGKYN